ncbi:HutD/Ves family protein [Segnochrobactrum spirostomi]|uniref:HutD family protein n=1 Tax=Segnochrobactrum spirostomi TaxID=2608987 RepID=A0A6A7Y2Q5_9HYPH|nr:HutD family protein [Segnochrobactrum spirostomi]MQT13026.1 HutD family protein [Segnochrobactrum spirostomi]
MILRRIPAAEHKVMPWRNGRGTTIEFARKDADDGTLLWRLSQADVTEDGPFSAFPGIDRTILLTDGPGFQLVFAGHGEADLTEPFRPVAFSGDWETAAVGVAGPCRDLNLMIARGRIAGALAVHRTAAAETVTIALPRAETSLFLALAGTWRLDGAAGSTVLAPRDLAIVEDGPLQRAPRRSRRQERASSSRSASDRRQPSERRPGSDPRGPRATPRRCATLWRRPPKSAADACNGERMRVSDARVRGTWSRSLRHGHVPCHPPGCFIRRGPQ